MAVFAKAVMRVVEAAVDGAWASAEVTVAESSSRADEVTDPVAGDMSTAEAGAITMTAEADATAEATTAGAGAMSTAHATTTAEPAAMSAAMSAAATAATASGLRIAQQQAASQDGRDQSH